MVGKTRQRAKPNAHSNNLAGIRGTMHSETDVSDSTIRLVVYQLTTSAQTPTCGIARATRACVYAVGGMLESPHGTVAVTAYLGRSVVSKDKGVRV